MSHTITHKDPSKKPCGCNTGNMQPSKLDALIARYRRLIAEVEAAKDRLVAAAIAIAGDLFEEATVEEVDAMFDDLTNSQTTQL